MTSARRSIFHATPMTWIVLGVVVLHTIGIGWGLPASDGWDNDGVAPRDFLPGLADTFTPGHYYTYPPVHLALLAVLTSPVVIAGVLRAPSHALGDIVHELLAPGYMTTIAYIARFTSMLMSIGIVLFAARMTEELRAFELGVRPADQVDGWAGRVTRLLDGEFSDLRVRRLGSCTAAFVGLEASITYYAHTTNLDVPYLFWGTASLLAFMRAIARDEPRRVKCAFLLAVLAVGTKDQAYALFGLSLPVALLLARPRLADVTKAAALAVGLFLVTDGVLFNPTGFAARVRFLTGPASQDFVEYTRDWSGRLGILRDAALYFDFHYPKLTAPLFILGFVAAVRAAHDRRARALALLPLLVAVSFTVLFNWASLRTNARFLIPQALMLSLYGAIGADALLFAERRSLRLAARAILLVPFVLALHTCISVDGNFVFDPRYEAEEWMREHVAPGQTIETYGLNVYLPRFPKGRRVIRVGPEPVDKRNPMPGITEVQDAFENAPRRDAHWIVLSEAWGWRYLFAPNRDTAEGRILAPNQERTANEEPATRFFQRLIRSEDDFVLVHYSDYEHQKWLPRVDIHGATGRSIWIYERKPER